MVKNIIVSLFLLAPVYVSCADNHNGSDDQDKGQVESKKRAEKKAEKKSKAASVALVKEKFQGPKIELMHKIPEAHVRSIVELEFSEFEGDKVLISQSCDCRRWWKLETGERVACEPVGLSFDFHGDLLASLKKSGWDIATSSEHPGAIIISPSNEREGSVFMQAHSVTTGITALDVSSDESMFATGDKDGTINIWRITKSSSKK